MSPSDYDIPATCDFSLAKNNSHSSNECSPRLLDPLFGKFTGVLINAPAQVSWPSASSPDDMTLPPTRDSSGPFKLMVAGYVRVITDSQTLGPDITEQVVIIAVNRETAEVYSGSMQKTGMRPSLFDGATENPDRAKHRVSAFFNVDLVQNLNIPIAEANYSIYAVFEKYKSNVLVSTVSID